MAFSRRTIVVAVAIALVAILGLVIRNQLRVSSGRQARAEIGQERRILFDLVQPVALSNCELKRFGEPHDGGYLMCANLLDGVRSGYSYGISGYDQWGCDISTTLNVPVHQYDCFNLTQPACPAGRTLFHAECVGDTTSTIEGRPFDTIKNQFAKNGDSSKRIVLKIDVEGAEWDSFLAAPDDIFKQIDQLAVEFHATQSAQDEKKYLQVVRRLKQFFEVAHIHYNNFSCIEGMEPFPTWAYEVLFVNKRLAIVDRSRKVSGPHPFDAPNNPSSADCPPKAR